MAQPHNTRARRGTRLHPALIVLLILIVGVTVIGSASLLGLKIPLLSSAADGRQPDRSGKVPVPIAARFIPAYTKVTRDYLINAETMEFTVVWVDEDKVEDAGLISKGGEILNRVLANDKHAAYGFSESDFLPKGTRAGPTAGVEPGMRGMRVPANEVRGMHGLRRGDRFDLIAVQELEGDGLQKQSSTVVHPRVQAGQGSRDAWNASTRVLVQNGKVVEPVDSRRDVGSSRREVEEVFIAVGEHEVAGLTEALTVGADILCLPRSGIPGAEAGLPDPDGPRAPKVIQVTAGDERWLAVVPDGEEPSLAMEGTSSGSSGKDGER